MIRRHSLVAVAVLLAARLASANTVQLVPPLQPSQENVRFDLLVLNDSDEVDPFRVPASATVRLTTPDGVVDATADTIDHRSGDLVPVAPRGFIRVPMVVKLKTAGRVMVELRGSTTPSVPATTIVEVVPPGSVRTASVESASQPTTQPTDETAMASEPPITLRNPFSIVTQRDPNFRSESGLVEFLNNRIRAHEPVYIVGGDEDPSTKFQISFKYQIFDPNGPLAQKAPGLDGLFFAYSQTSLWDLGSASSPFFDNSYRPEFMVSYDDLDRYLLDRDGDRLLPDWMRLGLQGGYRHESNGRDGASSRSYNTLFVRPIVTFSRDDGWFLSIAPRFFTYIFDRDDNPDIADYRGHTELRVVLGRGGGFQLAGTARLGNDFDKSGYQIDASFPIRQLSGGNLDVYFITTYFTGYGESLLNYNKDGSSLRFGLALVR